MIAFLKWTRRISKSPNIVSNRTLKRGPYGYKQAEAHNGAAQKFRAVEKEGRLHRLFATNQFPLLEQVDDFAFPTDMVGEKFMHPSFNDQTGNGNKIIKIQQLNKETTIQLLVIKLLIRETNAEENIFDNSKLKILAVNWCISWINRTQIK